LRRISNATCTEAPARTIDVFVGISEKLHACRRNGSEYICTSESISAA
jgi:hypothetical protein